MAQSLPFRNGAAEVGIFPAVHETGLRGRQPLPPVDLFGAFPRNGALPRSRQRQRIAYNEGGQDDR